MGEGGGGGGRRKEEGRKFRGKAYTAHVAVAFQVYDECKWPSNSLWRTQREIKRYFAACDVP